MSDIKTGRRRILQWARLPTGHLSHPGGVCRRHEPQLTLGLLWVEVLESLTWLKPGQSYMFSLGSLRCLQWRLIADS